MALGRASADRLAPDQKAKALGSVLKQVSSLPWAFSFSMHRNHACLGAGLPHRKSFRSVVFMWA